MLNVSFCTKYHFRSFNISLIVCCIFYSGNEMWEITIQGMAFLWHQVRCMVSVLFLIGLHLEAPEVS